MIFIAIITSLSYQCEINFKVSLSVSSFFFFSPDIFLFKSNMFWSWLSVKKNISHFFFFFWLLLKMENIQILSFCWKAKSRKEVNNECGDIHRIEYHQWFYIWLLSMYVKCECHSLYTRCAGGLYHNQT